MNVFYLIMGLEILMVVIVSAYLLNKAYSNYFDKRNKKDPFRNTKMNKGQ